MAYFAALEPGDTDHPVQVAANDRSFGGHRGHHLQLAKLCVSFLQGLFRHPRFVDLILKIINFVRRIIHLTELFLNRLHLLVEVILALTLLHLLLDPAADPLLNLKQIDFSIHQRLQMLESTSHIRDLENALFLLQVDAHMSRDGIGKTARLFDTGE